VQESIMDALREAGKRLRTPMELILRKSHLLRMLLWQERLTKYLKSE